MKNTMKNTMNHHLRPVVKDRLDRMKRLATFAPFLPGEGPVEAARRAWSYRWIISGDVQLRSFIDLDSLPSVPQVHDIECRQARRRWAKREEARPEERKALRRQLFSMMPVSQRVYFAKGCCSVQSPPGAVARIGGSESSYCWFLDRFGRVIEGWRARSSGPDTWPEPAPFVPDLQSGQWPITPLGRSFRDWLFGVAS